MLLVWNQLVSSWYVLSRRIRLERRFVSERVLLPHLVLQGRLSERVLLPAIVQLANSLQEYCCLSGRSQQRNRLGAAVSLLFDIDRGCAHAAQRGPGRPLGIELWNQENEQNSERR